MPANHQFRLHHRSKKKKKATHAGEINPNSSPVLLFASQTSHQLMNESQQKHKPHRHGVVSLSQGSPEDCGCCMWHRRHKICGLFQRKSRSGPELGSLLPPVKRGIHSIPAGPDTPPSYSQDIESVLICNEWTETSHHFLFLQPPVEQNALQKARGKDFATRRLMYT